MGQKSRILLSYPFKPGLISLFLEGAAQLSSTGGSQTEADAEVHPPGNEVPYQYQDYVAGSGKDHIHGVAGTVFIIRFRSQVLKFTSNLQQKYEETSIHCIQVVRASDCHC